MANGINHGRNVAQEVRDLSDDKMVTLTRVEARVLTGALPDVFDTLSTALDMAQGDDDEGGRYVVIYVEPGNL